MISSQLGHLCSQASRTTQEGEQVLTFLQGDLGFPMPREWLASIMLATAELANLADQLRETPAPGAWLRLTMVASSAIRGETSAPT